MTSSPSARHLAPDSRWRRPFTVLQTNLQEIDAVMDVEAAADAVVDYGADCWLVNTGGISSFYPTDLPFQTRNPFLAERASGDMFGDAVAAATARGIRVMARVDMSKVAAPIAAAHPEWLYRSPSGEPQVFGDLFSACPSGEYYQARALDVVDEILDRYDVDAIFFNQFNFNERDYDEVMHPPCHCDACVRGFAEFSEGAEHPTAMQSPTFGLWRRYTAATLARLTARIVDHVDARGRDIAVLLRRGAPVEYLEANNAYRAMPGKELWPFSTGEVVSAQVVSEPDAAVMVNCVAFVDATYRLAPEEPEHFAQYLVQTIARGGNPSAYFMGAPGRLPMDRALRQGRAVMRFRHDNADLYGRIDAAAPIALVRPDYGSAAPGKYWEVVEEFRGVFQALQQAHLPFDVVPIDAVGTMAARGGLERFELVILPDLGSLRGAAAELDGWIDRGGRVLITGASALDGDGAAELAASPARRTAGAARTGAEVWSSYVSDVAQPNADRFAYRPDIVSVFGAYQGYEWSDDSRPVGAYLPKASFAPPERAYGHRPGGEPGHVRRRAGAGEVVVVPWTVGRAFREFGKTDVRDYLVDIVRSLVSLSVSVEIHENVEVIAHSADAATVLHLINHTGLRRRSYGPHVPVGGGVVRVRGASGAAISARALVSGETLTIGRDGDDAVISLPDLDLFEVVEIVPAQ